MLAASLLVYAENKDTNPIVLFIQPSTFKTIKTHNRYTATPRIHSRVMEAKERLR